MHGSKRIGWITSSQNYRNFDRIDGEPMEFEWNIFTGFNTLRKIQKFIVPTSRNTRKFHRKNYIYVDAQRHFLSNERQWRRMCGERSTRISVCKKIWKGQWSFIGPGSERSGILLVKTVHKESETKLQKGCCWNSLRADVQFSVLRHHCPDVNAKAKDVENYRYTMQPTRKRLRLFASLFLQTSSVLRSSRRDV